MADITLAGWDATLLLIITGSIVAGVIVLLVASWLLYRNSFVLASDWLQGIGILGGGLALMIVLFGVMPNVAGDHDRAQRTAVLTSHYDDFELRGNSFTADNDGEFIRGQFRHVEGERWKIEVYQ